MTQPTGSATVNATWIAKGLKAGFYVTESGSFVFDNTSTPVAVSGGTWNTNAANTDPSASPVDIIVTPGNTGGTGWGAVHVGAASTSFLAAFSDNFTIIFDYQPASGAVGYDPGSFFVSGSNAAGGVFLQALSVDSASKSASLSVKDASYGPVRGASLNIAAGVHKRLAFRYSRGNPTAVFSDGSAVTPTSAVNDYSGPTINPSVARTIYGVDAYANVPSGSHIWIFDTLLSDADIASLAADPWQIFGVGSGGTAQITVAPSQQINQAAAAAIYQAGVSIGTLTTGPLTTNNGSIYSSSSGWTLDIFNASTGAFVVRKTGLTTSAAGVITVSDPLIVAGTIYSYEPRHATYGRALPVATAS